MSGPSSQGRKQGKDGASPTPPPALVDADPNATRLPIGDGLYVVMVDTASLKEQDVNAQVMQPREFDRLVENIRERGGLESLPYTHQPGADGPISIISGHHRFRAARAAGLERIPVILDVQQMSRGKIISKQIAHNELHGEPDKDVLAQLVAQLTDVDDMLRTGLPDDWLPTVEKDDTTLAIPHADFDWRSVTMMFLPAQLERLEDLVRTVARSNDMIGHATLDQFNEFSKAMIAYGHTQNIKSMASVVDMLTKIALRDLAEHEAKQAEEAAEAEAVEASRQQAGSDEETSELLAAVESGKDVSESR